MVWHGGQKRRVWAPCSKSHSSNSASLSKGQGKAVRLFLIFPWVSLGITSATLNQNSQQPVFMSSQRPHFSLLRAANMSQFCFVLFFWGGDCVFYYFLLRYNWHITLFRVYSVLIWYIYLSQEAYHHSPTADTFITSHSYHFVFCGEII